MTTPIGCTAQEINDALDLAECCVHDKIHDPNKREWVHGILRKLRANALSAVSKCGCIETYPQLVQDKVSHGPGCSLKTSRSPIRSALCYMDARKATRIALRFEDGTELDLAVQDFCAWLVRSWPSRN